MIKQLEDKSEWNKVYLIWPRVIQNKLIWLEHVERKWNSEINIVLDSSAYGYPIGGWEYRTSNNNKGTH